MSELELIIPSSFFSKLSCFSLASRTCVKEGLTVTGRRTHSSEEEGRAGTSLEIGLWTGGGTTN